ncbi:MAG: hypothetical protein PVG89_17880 [Gammaproteobacteria bacterium]|jgi:hypothetical protein
MKFKQRLILPGLVTIMVSACGGSGSNDCDTPLTANYVNTELTTEVIFSQYNISVSNTTLIHEDGDQGNVYDINRIMLSSIQADSGGILANTLAISYSAYATQDAPADSYMAFYIDRDGDSNTGSSIHGAEMLVLDAVGPSTRVGILDAYFQWNGTSWVPGTKYGITSSTASYLAGCTLGVAVFVPWYQDLAGFTVTNANGVMMLATFDGDDPNNAPNIIDETGVFTFSFP